MKESKTEKEINQLLLLLEDYSIERKIKWIDEKREEIAQSIKENLDYKALQFLIEEALSQSSDSKVRQQVQKPSVYKQVLKNYSSALGREKDLLLTHSKYRQVGSECLKIRHEKKEWAAKWEDQFYYPFVRKLLKICYECLAASRNEYVLATEKMDFRREESREVAVRAASVFLNRLKKKADAAHLAFVLNSQLAASFQLDQALQQYWRELKDWHKILLNAVDAALDNICNASNSNDVAAREIGNFEKLVVQKKQEQLLQKCYLLEQVLELQKTYSAIVPTVQNHMRDDKSLSDIVLKYLYPTQITLQLSPISTQEIDKSLGSCRKFADALKQKAPSLEVLNRTREQFGELDRVSIESSLPSEKYARTSWLDRMWGFVSYTLALSPALQPETAHDVLQEGFMNTLQRALPESESLPGSSPSAEDLKHVVVDHGQMSRSPSGAPSSTFAMNNSQQELLGVGS